MNKDKIKKILDKTDIYVLDEINILEYIDELEQVKEDYIKSIDKLDILDNRIDKAIEYIETSNNNPQPFYKYIFGDENGNVQNLDKLLNILRGEDNEE